MGVDPLRIFGSGALLATVPSEAVDAALDSLADAGIKAAVIGKVQERAGEPGALVLDGERVTDAPTDHLYPLWD
jgi:hydrogenase expression/formation protein HypE